MAHVLGADLLNQECKHGLTFRTCEFCKRESSWGMLKTASQHGRHFAELQGKKPAKQTKHDCARCKTLPPTRGHQVFVRLPRPARQAFGQDVPMYPPSWSGPLVARRKINKATHRTRNGRWLCDECDPKVSSREAGLPERKVSKVEKRQAVTVAAEDLFG